LPGGAARSFEHRDHIKVSDDPAVSPGVFVSPEDAFETQAARDAAAARIAIR
jgi:hypothetical protein